MGGGSYCVSNATARSESFGYSTKSTREVFRETKITNDMDPKNISIRESRDSEEHPDSLPVIFGLDVTGSMGSIPHSLITNGLTKIMGSIIQAGEQDPQVLFAAIGDHECDDSPLQISQFESSDELLDKWLKQVYLEGGGGGNDGESYLLAWYFANFHTEIDSFEKRNRKGFIFTIGDEKTLKTVSPKALEKIMGQGFYEQSYSAEHLYALASKRYNVYHIHVTNTGQGSRQGNIDDWKQLIGDNLLIANDHNDIPKIVAQTIIDHRKPDKPVQDQGVQSEPTNGTPDSVSVEEML